MESLAGSPCSSSACCHSQTGATNRTPLCSCPTGSQHPADTWDPTNRPHQPEHARYGLYNYRYLPSTDGQVHYSSDGAPSRNQMLCGCFHHAWSSFSAPRKAGVGILFVNTQVQPVQTIYVQAIMTGTRSVNMAEAAALALAAMVADLINFNDIYFLSDCSQLVHFLNGDDHNHPPDWRMKPFTQIFDNCATSRRAKVYKISRTLNTTADALTRQAFSVSVPTIQSFETVCSYSCHS